MVRAVSLLVVLLFVALQTACDGGTSPGPGAGTLHRVAAAATLQAAPQVNVAVEANGSSPAAYASPSFEIPAPDAASWQILASPTIPGPLQYSNDHTVVQGEDGNWHVIGINGGGNGQEHALYHTVLSSLYPPVPVSPSAAYPNVQPDGQDAPLAQFHDRNGAACTAWAPSSIKVGGTAYLLFTSGRDNNGNCSGQVTRLEILKSTDPKLETWTSVNSYPDATALNAPVTIGVTVTGVPASQRYAGSNAAVFDTGWPLNFRDPGIFQDSDGTFYLYSPSFDRALGHSIVAVYRSTDLLNWTYVRAALTLVPGALDVNWAATESPFVFKRGDWYYLSLTDTASNTNRPLDYEDTILLRSKDPTDFGSYDGTVVPHASSGLIAVLPLHAPEFMQDASGQWYVTTCGWAGASTVPQAKHGVAITKLNFDSAVPIRQQLASYTFDSTGTVPGVSGQALYLDSGRTMTVSPVQLTGDFTVDAWVNPSHPPTNADGVFHSSEGYDLNFYQGYPRFYAGPSRGDLLISSMPIAAGTWTHVALTRAGGTMSLYLNGLKVAQGDSTWTNTISIAEIGKSVAGSLTGALDELHVYQRALTTVDINNLIQSYAIRGGVPQPIIAGDFTVASWVNIPGTPSNANVLFSGTNGMNVNFYSTYPRLYGGSSDMATSSIAIPGDAWTHVAVKRQAGTVTVYVNGVASGSGGWTAPFWITAVGQPQGGNIMGRLAHVVMTNQALTASQIQAQAGMPASGYAQWMP